MLYFFVAGTTARTAADLTNTNKNTAVRIFNLFRQIVSYGLAKEAFVFDGKIEIDESYFGGVRKGKRGRGAAGKSIVFGLLKRGDKVYAQVVGDVKRATLLPIIKEKVQPDSMVYTDKMKSYNSLKTEGFKHKRINHGKRFAKGSNYINGIENFWSQAKRHLRKFNGVPQKSFDLFLQECVWRFNYPTAKLQLQTLKKWIKIYYKSNGEINLN
jgi:transposase